MNKFRIGIFASSQSLIDRIQKIAARQEDHIYISTQGLENAIPLGKEMQRNGIEVIISRRGTAHLLRENLHIPVLSFPHRSLDILISLKKAASLGKQIMLPAFRHEMSGISILEELLGIKLLQMVYQDKASLEQAIISGHKKGCDVVVGGSVTQEIAENHNLKYVEIRTSDEDIAATIENAKSVAQSNRDQKTMTLRYRSIIDASSECIIAVDEKGTINNINETAKTLLGIDEDAAIGRPIVQLIKDCPIHQVLRNQKPVHDRLGQIDNERYIFTYLPVMLDSDVIGAVSTFRELSKVMRTENVVRRSLSKGLVAKYRMEDLVHVSPGMRDVVNMSREFAKTDSTILVMGETGTGKEILVHGIHNDSRRSKHPFVSVNCAALPEQLLESELFGYEEGAFTGSKKGGKPGRFEIAHQGTIFLDEIDSTPPSVQIRLLRVLQEKEVMRVGGDRKIPVDVRIIAAASRDLSLAVQEDQFREDLFFRLNVLRVQIPALRNRREDLPVLIDYFIHLFSDRNGLEPIQLPEDYLRKLMDYTWPGNVRQLRNFSERIVMNCSLRCSPDMLAVLYNELIEYRHSTSPPEDIKPEPKPLKLQIKKQISSNEKQIIFDALTEARFSRTKAAALLGISRTTLWRKIREFNLE